MRAAISNSPDQARTSVRKFLETHIPEEAWRMSAMIARSGQDPNTGGKA